MLKANGNGEMGLELKHTNYARKICDNLKELDGLRNDMKQLKWL